MPNNHPHEPRLTDHEKRLLARWADEPAPGETRLTNLPTPPLQIARKPAGGAWRLWAQAAAAIVLFVSGYVIGQNRSPVAAPQQVVNMAAPQPPAPATPPPPPPSSATGATPAATPPEACPEPVIRQGTDGRFRIETILCETGSRATWVINPKLELAQIQKPKKDAAQ